MRLRKVDQSGDMRFGRGQTDFWKDKVEGVAQLITSRMHLWTGEWFLDVTEGMPWRTKVLGKGTTALRDSAIRTRVLSTKGVSELVSYSSTVDPVTRTFTPSITVKTLYGVTTVTEPM